MHDRARGRDVCPVGGSGVQGEEGADVRVLCPYLSFALARLVISVRRCSWLLRMLCCSGLLKGLSANHGLGVLWHACRTLR